MLSYSGSFGDVKEEVEPRSQDDTSWRHPEDVPTVFKAVREGKRVLKASQCYLWTTSGPIAGMLFVSTERIAFCSDRPIKFSSTEGDLIGRSYYKVSVPIANYKVDRVAQTETAKRPKKAEMYLQVVTRDEFEFWFMGIVGLKKTLKCLQQVACCTS